MTEKDTIKKAVWIGGGLRHNDDSHLVRAFAARGVSLAIIHEPKAGVVPPRDVAFIVCNQEACEKTVRNSWRRACLSISIPFIFGWGTIKKTMNVLEQSGAIKPEAVRVEQVVRDQVRHGTELKFPDVDDVSGQSNDDEEDSQEDDEEDIIGIGVKMPDLSSYRSKWHDITPDLAKRILETRMSFNRPVDEAFIQRLAEKMRAGRWKPTHEGIGFNKQRQMIDGYHRMRAIVSSGVTIRMLVTYDLPDDSFFNVNQDQKIRNTRDQAFIIAQSSGIDTSHMSRVVAVGKAMLQGISQSASIDPGLVSRFSVEKRDDIMSTIGVLRVGGGPGRILHNAPCVASIVNAFRSQDGYPGAHGSQDRDIVLAAAARLADLTTMKAQASGNDDPLAALWKSMSSTYKVSGVRMKPSKMYALVVRGMRAELNGEPMKKMVESSVDWE